MFTYLSEETTASRQPTPCHRSPSRPKKLMRMVRPSLIDPRFTGDPWIVDEQNGTFALCLGNYCLVGIQGVPIDLPSFNQAFDRLRNRRPRRRVFSNR